MAIKEEDAKNKLKVQIRGVTVVWEIKGFSFDFMAQGGCEREKEKRERGKMYWVQKRGFLLSFLAISESELKKQEKVSSRSRHNLMICLIEKLRARF